MSQKIAWYQEKKKALHIWRPQMKCFVGVVNTQEKDLQEVD